MDSKIILINIKIIFLLLANKKIKIDTYETYLITHNDLYFDLEFGFNPL